MLGGENALPCFAPGGVNAQGLDRIVYNTKALDPPLQVGTAFVTVVILKHHVS